MKFLIRFRYFSLFLVTFLLGSCGWILTDHRYDYLKERQSESVEVASDQATRPIVDYYPIPTTQENLVSSDSYEVPLPPQVFSSGSTNEIRMHRLGELRWLYVETLPSSVWPLMKDFWSSGDFGLTFEDPNTGVLESANMPSGSSEGKLQMKIEHGIRQASSEIFLSHLMKDSNNNWVKVPVENNLEDKILREALDYLSKAPSTGGTSLVALNLNLGQKAILKQSEDGTSLIEINLEFPRAWAAVDRALKEALITVQDLDRTNGVFFVTFSKEEEVGFIKGLFRRDRASNQPDFRIYIKKVGKSKCTVTVVSESQGGKTFERDLLSEINQSLS